MTPEPPAEPSLTDARSVADLAEERARLWADAHRARALAHERARLQALLDMRRSSVSWRVTAPLRRAAAAVRYRRGPTDRDTSNASRA
jgi:hypothetical protein